MFNKFTLVSLCMRVLLLQYLKVIANCVHLAFRLHAQEKNKQIFQRLLKFVTLLL